MVGALPGNGMKVIATFAARLKLSKAICELVVGPVLANDSSPGLARAAATKSSIVRYGDVLFTKMICGDWVRSQIGAKLSNGLKFSLRRCEAMRTAVELMNSVLPSGLA